MDVVSQTMETEEDLLPLLRVQLYHPQQSSMRLYAPLHLGTRSRHSAEDPLRLGRDARVCALALSDVRVSRKQLALHAYRTPRSPDTLFAIQNLSQRARLSVNGAPLAYLERAELPDKALVRFGEYEMLVVRESGEAKGSFEVEVEVLAAPPSRETCARSGTPVQEAGSGEGDGVPGGLRPGPLETDEICTCHS